MRASGRCTRVLILTGEVELGRLVRTTLEPACNVTTAAPVPMKLEADAEAFDIVLIDLEPFDLDAIAHVRRAHPNAEVVAICREYREVDCIEVLQRGADYLARPFRKHDLLARVRVAELRLFNAAGRPRYSRHGPLVVDLFDQRVFFDGQPVALSPSQMKCSCCWRAAPACLPAMIAFSPRSELLNRRADDARYIPSFSYCGGGSNGTRDIRSFSWPRSDSDTVLRRRRSSSCRGTQIMSRATEAAAALYDIRGMVPNCSDYRAGHGRSRSHRRLYGGRVRKPQDVS